MQSGIYGIHNVINGKWYVGQSTNIPYRKSRHFSYLRNGKHHNTHLQLSFYKHGESSFEFLILEEVAENMMDVRERAWIEYYKTLDPLCGYNLDSGGNLNKHHSTETKAKMGRKKTEKQKLAIAENNKTRYLKMTKESKLLKLMKNRAKSLPTRLARCLKNHPNLDSQQILRYLKEI